MSSLADREKIALLETARRALVDAVKCGRRPDIASDPALVADVSAASAGAFVTLRCRGKLRGCIGQIGTGLPLEVVVAHCAGAAATEDPRFRPLKTEELGDAELEISILSEPQEISPEAIVVGKHGLIVHRGEHRGLLLPQVADEYHLTAERFLEETCVKAGLTRDAWKYPDTQVQGFTAEVFSEKEIDRARGRAPSPSNYSTST